MKINHFLITILLASSLLFSCGEKGPTKALVKTNHGDITIMLYDETPIHRDNFIKLVNEKFYDGLLFHRVIPGFMIQGGDPESKGAAPGASLGRGGPGYTLEAELGFQHYRGALAAASSPNPAKRSSGSQFYLVVGRQVSDAQLDGLEARKGFTYSDAQRTLYKEVGGRPELDNEYTVFGEMLDGYTVIDQIANVAKDGQNRPTQDVIIESISIIK